MHTIVPYKICTQVKTANIFNTNFPFFYHFDNSNNFFLIVIDLYGQCAQVSIVNSMQSSTRAPYAISENSQSIQAASVIAPVTEVKHRLVNKTSLHIRSIVIGLI